jgi:hypothetical protein
MMITATMAWDFIVNLRGSHKASIGTGFLLSSVSALFLKRRRAKGEDLMVSHRIPIIKECLRELKRYEGRPKPIDKDLYRLIRNIAKYIVEQEIEQTEPPEDDSYECIKGATDVSKGNTHECSHCQSILTADGKTIATKCTKPQLFWVECDKGWFSAEEQYKARIINFISLYFSSKYIDGVIEIVPSLAQVMLWADERNIPYEISTVRPDGK